MSDADEPAIDPTQLRCGDLAFLAQVPIGADEERIRSRIRAELRRCIAGWVALGLAACGTSYLGLGFALLALDPDGNRPPVALATFVFCFLGVLCTAAVGIERLRGADRDLLRPFDTLA